MCLHVKKYAKKRIAKKNIVVWKILKLNLRSEYKNFQYRLGRIYKTDFGIYSGIRTGGYSREIREGYHSFKYLEDAQSEAGFTLGDPRRAHLTIYKAEIPKGSEYYEGDFWGKYPVLKSIVSNQIKIIEEIDL